MYTSFVSTQLFKYSTSKYSISEQKEVLLKRKNLSSIMERTLFYPKKIEKKYSKIPANDEVLSTFLL